MQHPVEVVVIDDYQALPSDLLYRIDQLQPPATCIRFMSMGCCMLSSCLTISRAASGLLGCCSTDVPQLPRKARTVWRRTEGRGSMAHVPLP
jgi:hypothetical protein